MLHSEKMVHHIYSYFLLSIVDQGVGGRKLDYKGSVDSGFQEPIGEIIFIIKF